MIIIPIGVDCGITFLLRDNNMRTYSWPFDWVVTYNGVTDIFKDKFTGYLPKDRSQISCDTYFQHNTFPDDLETMQRRIDRFLDLLNNTKDEIIFFRKGHAVRHHHEATEFKVNLKNDLKDAEELHDYIIETFPDLKFRIILVLICGECFDCNNVYKTNRKNLNIFNIATKDRDEEHFKFNSIFYDIFLKH
jgi:hypothetical protein